MSSIRRRLSFWDVEGPQNMVLKHKRFLRKSVYMGVVMREDENILRWALTCYDGAEFLGFHEDIMDVGDILDPEFRWECITNKIVHTLNQYMTSHNYRIQAVCIGQYDNVINSQSKASFKLNPLHVAAARFWFELDAITYITEVKGLSLEEGAASAARKVIDR